MGSLDHTGVRRALAGLLCAVVGASAAAAQPSSLRPSSDLNGLSDSIVGQALKRAGVRRAVVGVSLHGRRAYFGYSAAGEAPIGPADIVEIASVTKVFTTTLIAEEFDTGRIRPNVSIQTYLPSTQLGACAAKITPVELANFTAGLPRDAPVRNRPLQQQTIQNYPEQQFLGWVAQYGSNGGAACPTLPAPSLYSNASVGVLGPILANVEGRPWASLVAERITLPLGMNDTAIEPRRGEQVQGYGANGQPAAHWPVFAWYAAGGLRSTPQDMLSFGEAGLGHNEVNGRRVPPVLQEGLRNAMQNQLTWVRQMDGTGGTIFQKNGGNIGFADVIVVDQAKDCTIYIVANKQNVDVTTLGVNLMRAIGR